MSPVGCDTPEPVEGLAGVTEGPVLGLCPAACARWLGRWPALSPAGWKPPGWGVTGAELRSWTQTPLAPLRCAAALQPNLCCRQLPRHAPVGAWAPHCHLPEV